ncbi:MAG: hypothetical protein WCV93_05805 [Candidatus Shapirobacteria bacterium]
MERTIYPSFWLINVDETTATVALVSSSQTSLPTINLAPISPWQADSPETLIKAIDSAILTISANISLPEDQEPDSVGFVIPPFWVSSDGKITSSKLGLVEKVCKDLTLKPLGFVPSDEAVVEYFASKDSNPQSFVLTYFDDVSFVVSLVIVGKITQRIRHPFTKPFDPQIFQDCFSLFPPDSVFPPQIFLFGQTTPSIIQLTTNFRWPTLNGRDFFLHLPEITSLSSIDSFLAFSSVITPPTSSPLPPSAPLVTTPSLVDVDPTDLGFSNNLPPEEPKEEPKEELKIEPKVPGPSVKLPELNLPKIKVPNFSHKIWLVPAFVIIFAVLFYLLPSASVIVFLSPFSVDEKIPVVLGSSSVPTSLINLDIATSATISTTGTKVIGDNAKGEITLYNKVSQAKNLPRGLILLDQGKKKYELASPVQVPPSTAKLEEGIIEMGQTKVSIIASDIGPEFNLATNTNLVFKDYPETELVARTSSEISGGNRSEVKIVSTADKTKITQEVKKNIKFPSSTPDLLSGSWQTKSEKIQLNREVGEVSDLLSAKAEISLTAHLLSESSRSDLIKSLISKDSQLSSSSYNLSDFSFEFIPEKFEATTAKGFLQIKGSFTPSADTAQIAKLIAGRRPDLALNILRRSLSRLYNWRFTSPLNLVQITNLFPFNPNRINVEIKSQ